MLKRTGSTGVKLNHYKLVDIMNDTDSITDLTKINLERNDFLLPHVVDFVESENWLNLRPEYQRRLVWNQKTKSIFIESLLLNIPIPPVFLYEHELNQYEVVDGQQRLNAICEFYNNKFKLTGMETLKALNDRTFSQCPDNIKRELARRRISATTIEPLSIEELNKFDIRKEVFNRLNTGGRHLNNQELRNCNYPGVFNELLVELAATTTFTKAWGIPPYKYSGPESEYPPRLLKNTTFNRMLDCENVLRFFAINEFGNATKGTMDKCMAHYLNSNEDKINSLRRLFILRINALADILGDRIFKAKDPENGTWTTRKQIYDAQMQAIGDFISDLKTLKKNKKRVIESIEKKFDEDNLYERVIEQHQTAKSIKKNTSIFTEIFRGSIS